MNPIKTQLNQLLAKQMDRKDFIKHVAIGVVALTGAGTALKLLSGPQKKSTELGYGGSAYGGDKTTKKLG